MKHTKGKWSLRKLFESPIDVKDDHGREWKSNSIDIIQDSGRVIASIGYQTDVINQGWGTNNNIAEFEANAKLISKAPELLEALKRSDLWIKSAGGRGTNFSKELESLLKEIES